jgi:Protein of unknown function (DUF2877)
MSLAPPPTARLQPVAGAASTALRAVVGGQSRTRRSAKVIAVFPSALYLDLQDVPEPRVVAVVASDAVRLPNSIVVGAAMREAPFAAVRELDHALVGDGSVEIAALRRLKVRVRRWWESSPVLASVSPARLAQNLVALGPVMHAESHLGLAGHPGPLRLARYCGAGDLARAVDAAERIVGLGPGLTPSGDDVLAGLLIALRLLGNAVDGGHRAVWLADWISAAVTADAGTRTTALAATLLHCASRGQASAEVAALLRGLTGLEPALPALRRLLAAGHTSGSDLAWGVLAGCQATLALAASCRRHTATLMTVGTATA